MLGGIKAAVAMRVTRKGHDAESAPYRKLIAIVKELVGTKGWHAKHTATDPFGDAGNAAPAGVTSAILEVLEITLWSGDPRSVLTSERGRVEDMIEVAVREQDAADGQMTPAARVKGLFQSAASAEEAGVDQIQGIAIPQDEELHDEGADDEEIGRHENSCIVPQGAFIVNA